jgi:hypothetical protein
MSNHRFAHRLLVLVVAGVACLSLRVHAQTVTQLPPAGFDWSRFNVAGGFVKSYLKNDGTAGGMVTTYMADVFDLDNDPNEKDPLVGGKEKIGSLTFQYVLYQEEGNGKGTGVNGLGAALFGGFHLTDVDDVGTNFAFLQSVGNTDNVTGNSLAGYPKVDGGPNRGKTNGDIPGYDVVPDNTVGHNGWNFAGTEFDYFDNPLRGINTNQTVSFETALVCYNGLSVTLLSDFTWSFSTDAAGGITGIAPTNNVNTAGIRRIYGAAFPTTTYNDIGTVSCHLPEPSAITLLAACALSSLGFVARRKRSRKAA